MNTIPDTGWVKLADFAKQKGVRPQTMRRRLVALGRARNIGVFLQRMTGGHFWVHPDNLRSELQRDPFESMEIQTLRQELENLRRSVEALKTWRKLLIKRGVIPASVARSVPAKEAERGAKRQPPTYDR